MYILVHFSLKLNIITITKMKKKMNISVCDIVSKVASPKNIIPAHQRQHSDCPIIVDKPMSFEDLYRRVVENGKNGEMGPQKIVYESKKVTPIQTNRMKKQSVNSLVNYNNPKSNASSAQRSCKTTTPLTSKVQARKKSNSKSKQGRKLSHSKSKSTKKIPTTAKKSALKQSKPVNLEQCLKYLNHEEHSHIRERNQCFLSEREINILLKKLGYDLKDPKYNDLLTLLEVDIYGGAPSQNLKQVLRIIESGHLIVKDTSSRAKLPKIVDNNLQLTLTPQKEDFIRQYFASFGPIQHTNQKQNSALYANQSSISKKIHSFHNILQQKSDRDNQCRQNSPDRTKVNSAFTDLIEVLNQSQKKRLNNNFFEKLQPLLQDERKKEKGLNEEENMNTFRKIEQSGFEIGSSQYNFSRQLSGDKLLNKEQDTIIELKNRLNQALKKSCFETNAFLSQDPIYSGSGSPNKLSYSRKPILSVDVNLGQGISQKIIVFEGETAREVSDRLAAKFTISLETKNKFQKMLQSHLNTMLWKIDQLSEQMLTDRDPQ